MARGELLLARNSDLMYICVAYMYEKYNAFRPGVGGGGGEYVPQRGFGWTNGVALVLLDRLGATFDEDCRQFL